MTWILRTAIVTILLHSHFVCGLRCIQCSQSHFNGEPGLDSCYKVNGQTVRNTTNCITTESDSYCFTKVELSDGIISYIERGCTNTRFDPIHAPNGIPNPTKCTTSYSTSNLSVNSHQTECFVACKRDNCNDVPLTDSLKSCPRECPANSECNYITGKCQCAHNRSGSDCNSEVPLTYKGRSCVQCNSKILPGCANKTTGTQCPNGETHCSTTQTWILEPDGTLANNPVVTRGCARRYMSPDRCYLTAADDIAIAKYTEYTCVSTCSTDNCNVGDANGVLDEGEFIPMKCVVCEGNEINCGPHNSLTTDCPANTSHCFSTVTYWESDVNDSGFNGRLRPEPAISIRSIKRGCAASQVMHQCTTKRLGRLNLNEITCQESCSGDGCNTGWPCRPDCVQCEKANHDSGSDECIFYPPAAKPCPGPHHGFCYFYLQNRTRYQDGNVDDNVKHSAYRGCSATYDRQRDNTCNNLTDHGRVMGLECEKYCATDGCNYKKNDFYAAKGLECYSCDSLTNGFDGESGTDTCFTPLAAAAAPLAATNTATCLTDTATVKYYCRATFTVTDGVVTRVQRGCAATDADEDTTSTSAIPTTDKCITTLLTTSDPTDTTVCYFHCSAADKCNSEVTSTLQTCSSDCNRPTSKGSCNYLTGTCQCATSPIAYTGSDCATASTTTTTTPRKCVQCNSATDSGCSTSTTGVDCPAGEMYCSSAHTTIYDESDATIATIMTRGCTAAFRAVDECAFTSIFNDDGIASSGYNEFTCFSTCDSDSCNVNTPNGIVDGTEAKVLQCVVCNDVSGCASSTAREACPSGTTHCKATVTYLISEKVDLNHEAEPAYKLVSVVRECATAAVTTECTDSTIGSLSLKKVTCQETCQTDGCNEGWPARPTCLTCASTYTALGDGYDECLESPEPAAACTYPYQAYCVIVDQGIEKNKLLPVQGYTRRIVRGCSHYDIGTGCSEMTPRSTVIENCNYTCTTDSCNVGSGSTMPIQTVVAVVLPAIFGWLAQLYL